MRHYLITGAGGYVASWLIPALLNEGHHVIALDLADQPDSSHFVGVQASDLSANLRWYRADVSETALLDVIFRRENPDICIHLAKPDYRSLDLYLPEERRESQRCLDFASGTALAALANYIGVLEVAIRNGRVPVIFSSSDSVYGPNMSAVVNESSTPHPISSKGVLNLMMEQYGRFYALRYGLPVTALRFFNIYGAWRKDWSGDVITRFCRALLDNEAVQIFGSGHQQRDFVHIDDAVRATLKVAENPSPGFNLYNVCTSQGISLLEVVKVLSSVSGRVVPIEHQAGRLGDLHCAVGSNKQLQMVTGYAPRMSLGDGLRQTLDQAGLLTMRRALA